MNIRQVGRIGHFISKLGVEEIQSISGGTCNCVCIQSVWSGRRKTYDAGEMRDENACKSYCKKLREWEMDACR